MFAELAGPIVAVDPNVMVTPMARHPAPILATRPIAIPVGVVRLIADFDIDTEGVDR